MKRAKKTRANIYRQWTSGRVAAELARATKKAALLAAELNRRELEADKLERREAILDLANGQAKTHEEAFMLAHLASGASP